MVIACIISFIVGALVMMCAIGLMSCQKDKKPRNKVRFFITKDLFRVPGRLKLWLGKPVWDNKYLRWVRPNEHVFFLTDDKLLELYNINPSDFKDMKPKEIREVFLNLED